QANVLEGVVGHDMDLVEHEQVLALVLEQCLRDSERGLGARAPWRNASLAGQDVDEAEWPDRGVREIVDDVALLLELIGELAEEQALAAAGLGDQRGDALDLDGEAQPLERLGEAAMAMQGGLGCVAAERMSGQAEVTEQ